ncbi:MAG: HAD family hydrolase, partial [Ruthenibacterium lactatiformans]
MIRSLKDILVVSDMDNTLLTPEDGVPFVNQVTMRLFCALGGHFTVATGRTMESAGRHLDSMTLSAPAILYGGGVIYDFEHDIR